MFLTETQRGPSQCRPRQRADLRWLQDVWWRSCVFSVVNTCLIAIVSWLFVSSALAGQVPMSWGFYCIWKLCYENLRASTKTKTSFSSPFSPEYGSSIGGRLLMVLLTVQNQPRSAYPHPCPKDQDLRATPATVTRGGLPPAGHLYKTASSSAHATKCSPISKVPKRSDGSFRHGNKWLLLLISYYL